MTSKHCVKSEKCPNTGISPYSVRMQENTDQKKLRIWTLFTQSKRFHGVLNTKHQVIHEPKLEQIDSFENTNHIKQITQNLKHI